MNPQNALEKTIPLPNEIQEGWGITNTKDELVISDGSEKLFFIDPRGEELKISKILKVKDNISSDYYYHDLNELEYAYDYIFSNIWFSNTVLIIDPENGNVIK